jgi:hypothetical protein
VRELTINYIRMKNTLLLLLIIISSSSIAQQQEPSNGGQKGQVLVKNKKELSEHERYQKLLVELDGTFQVRLKDDSKKPLFSETILIRIKEARLYNQSVVLDIEEGISVFIPSQTEISSVAFVKLDKVVYQLKTIGYDEK